MRDDFKFFLFAGIIALAIIIFIAAYLIFFVNDDPYKKNNPFAKGFTQDNTPNIENPDNTDNTESTDALDGESTSSKYEEEPHSAGGCRFSYAFDDIDIVSECKEFNGNICTKKTINCSVNVENLEESLGGLFKIKLSFLENKVLFQEVYKEKNLSSKESETMSSLIEIESSGEDGRANKDLSCVITSVEIPRKEVCN